MYQFLDSFFFVFHTCFTLFNLTGWIFRRTRRLHLVTILLTALSWFVLGILYGWGYCVCTDWHFRVREKLGYANESNSYIHFLIGKLTGIWLDETMVETWTLILFLLVAFLSIWLNLKDRRRSK